VQARVTRVRPGSDDPGPPPPDRFWAIVAIIAIIFATAGWTTTGVLLLTGPSAGAPETTGTPGPSVAVASEDASGPIDTSEPSDVSSHEAPDLEAMLPGSWEDTALSAQSWTGENVLIDQDPWSDALRAFVTKKQLNVSGLSVAQALDTQGALDLVVGAFRLSGANATTMIEGLTSAWMANDSTFKTSVVTVGGASVTKGVSTDTPIVTYWLKGNGVVFDIETADATLAAAVVKAMATGNVPGSLAPKPSSPGPS